MKKVLITGKNSFVGNAFESWIAQSHGDYSIDKVSMREDSWREVSLKGYDSILHVAGIAHVSTDPKMEGLYYKVNRDMTIELAKKAKAEGVRQFIFMSSIIVYGDVKETNGYITKETIPNPLNFYGRSKLEAEEGILSLEDETFKVCIVRPPLIYGKGARGNYNKLSKLAKISPIFPDLENKRSMLHIDNLSEFICLMIKNVESGIFFPQNFDYVCTSNLVFEIGILSNKKIYKVSLFNQLIVQFSQRVNFLNKMFGNLIYDKKMSNYRDNYQIRSFEDSIKLTEFSGVVVK